MSISETLKTGYFINGGLASSTASKYSGFWEPHTSSVDFCESNYLLSHHIVEPHNVWSSLLGISLFGIVGIVYGNPIREWRTFLIYFILLVIGLGSACLHASLHWFFQSFDELPMIYLVIGCLYAILEMDSPTNSPRYLNLAKYLILLSCVNTAVYYKFQHLYAIFLLTFFILIVCIFSLHVQIAWRLYKENNKAEEKSTWNFGNSRKYYNNCIILRFYAWHHIAITLVAFPIWVLDQFHCDYLLPIYNKLPLFLRGMTLHVVWHTCAGLGAYFFVQFLVACRASALGMTCTARCVLGVLPVVAIVSTPTPTKAKNI